MGIYAPYLGNYQTDNSNTIASVSGVPIKVQFGWGQVQGNNSLSVNDAVTFPVAFTTVLGVNVSAIGAKVTTSATSITDLTAQYGVGQIDAVAEVVTTTGFNCNLQRAVSALASTVFYGYSWIAWGI